MVEGATGTPQLPPPCQHAVVNVREVFPLASRRCVKIQMDMKPYLHIIQDLVAISLYLHLKDATALPVFFSEFPIILWHVSFDSHFHHYRLSSSVL